jgi:hypothetical protein
VLERMAIFSPYPRARLNKGSSCMKFIENALWN